MKYIKNYPRPQFVRDEWENLNGEWDFSFDDENNGEKEKYFINFPAENRINVPFTYETKLSGIEDESVHYSVWYSRKINVLKEQIQNKNILLHFEGSDYLTKVWINGKYVGKNEGGYSRFSFEINNYLKEGENELVVKAEDSLAKEQPRGKQRYEKESFACWYVQTTGIWKTVWIEYVPKFYIKNVKITPDADSETVKLVYETNISEKQFEDNEFYIETKISFADEVLNTVKKHLTSSSWQDEIRICENDDIKIKKWSPQSPDLYDISFKLYCNSEQQTDTVYSYFGVRKISVQNDKILLNDEELYLRLILDQGYWQESHLTPPNEEALIRDIDTVLEYGYNGVRKHQKVEDERFLYWCDVKGVLVWGEMASCYNFNDKAVQNFVGQWLKVVKQNYNHPSIITWVPINESWGVGNIHECEMQQSYANSLYYLTKSIDSTRPVISSDGWEHTISDIITIHDYNQDGNALYDTYSDDEKTVLKSEKANNVNRYLFAKGYEYKGQPVIMSEYGGISLKSEDGWYGYGDGENNEYEFFERYEALTKAIQSIPYIKGYCYTQLSDVQQEKNGLVCENRKDKFSDMIKSKIKKVNQSKI
ncbi:MAG: glycoside hydrolase family 2 protein [Acutalibacteraceae bacterium]